MLRDNRQQVIGNIFTELPTVDSTNNFALGKVHDGVAFHGNVYFAHDQFAGKGQFGKKWDAVPNQNIMMSVVLEPDFLEVGQQFVLNAWLAGACVSFLTEQAGDVFRIKWPNDLYWNNKKAGGILIENVIQGNKWKFAILGIGININQTQFPVFLPNPVSLTQITGKNYSPVSIAKLLCIKLDEKYKQLQSGDFEGLLNEYNKSLFNKNQPVKLRKGNVVFETTIVEVTAEGKLHTKDVMDRFFDFGEVGMVL